MKCTVCESELDRDTSVYQFCSEKCLKEVIKYWIEYDENQKPVLKVVIKAEKNKYD
jgi:predicted nucleic acid-binding Zn ribbon protein